MAGDEEIDPAKDDQPFSAPFVKTEMCDGIAELIINRPDVSNALNWATLVQLHRAFCQVADDPRVRGIVIGGAGKAFVAGADIQFFLRNMRSGNLDRIFQCIQAAQELFRVIQRCGKPVVARLHGAALGGGVELALACDHIIASPRATLAFPETGLGIFPSGGGTQRTPRRIGMGLAKWLIYSGQGISPIQSQAIGLIDQVVPHEQLPAAARLAAEGGQTKQSVEAPAELESLNKFFAANTEDDLHAGTADPGGDNRLARAMKRVGSKGPLALRVAERLIDVANQCSLEEGLQMELDHVLEIYRTEDAYHGLTCVVERKQPVFQGR